MAARLLDCPASNAEMSSFSAMRSVWQASVPLPRQMSYQKGCRLSHGWSGCMSGCRRDAASPSQRVPNRLPHTTWTAQCRARLRSESTCSSQERQKGLNHATFWQPAPCQSLALKEGTHLHRCRMRPMRVPQVSRCQQVMRDHSGAVRSTNTLAYMSSVLTLSSSMRSTAALTLAHSQAA